MSFLNITTRAFIRGSARGQVGRAEGALNCPIAQLAASSATLGALGARRDDATPKEEGAQRPPPQPAGSQSPRVVA